MPSLKDVKLQIESVKKTKQITKAMNLVASSKLRGAQSRIEHFRPYADKFGQLLNDLSARTTNATHPLLEIHENPKVAVIILITSDRGLCGAFNMNIINEALKLAAKKKAEGMTVQFIPVGKKARDAVVKEKYTILESFIEVLNNFSFTLATHIGEIVIQGFSTKAIDDVAMVYGQFKSVARQIPSTLAVLPVIPVTPDEDSDYKLDAEYVYEPSEASILSELLPRYVNCQIYRGLLDTSASENAARMTAMDNATRNCNDMIKALTLLFNKTRQAAITSELMDIVGGAEALRS